MDLHHQGIQEKHVRARGAMVHQDQSQSQDHFLVAEYRISRQN